MALSTADHRPETGIAGNRASVVAAALALTVGVVIALPSAATGQETPTCNGRPATILGTPGDDVLFGTDGDDVIVSLAGNDLIRGEAGNDVICGGRDHDEIWGGTGDDAVFGGGGPDELRGGPGYDDIWGGAGDDLLRGGADDDRLTGGDGDDTLMGGAGNDLISGDAGSDMLYGNSGRDSLAAGVQIGEFGAGVPVDEDEQVWGGWGADSISIQPGTSVVDGGGHRDEISWNGDAPVVIDLAAGTLTTPSGDLSVLSNIEDAWAGGQTNGVVRGDDGPNRLFGCCTLDGGAGNDRITMFSDDTASDFDVIGGPGADRLVVWDRVPGLGVVVDLQNGTIGGAYTGVLSGFETVIGTDLDDTLIGDGGPNVLWGRFGDDTIIGGGGDDILRGFWGDDTIYGGPGNDKLYGGTQNDTLDGGPGSDALDGRSGRDLCVNGERVIRCEAGWFRAPHDEAVFGEGSMVSVTAGGPGLVAVGTDQPGDDSVAAVWASPDGTTWSRVPHDEAVFGGAGSLRMVSVTVGGPGLVAVGSEGSHRDGGDAAVWTSPDGTTWSRVPHDEAVFGGAGSQLMESVTVGGPGLVAVGDGVSGAAVWTSPDGIAWSRVPHNEEVFGGRMDGVTAGGPGLVAVGHAGLDGLLVAAVWTSPDGIAWSRVPHDEALLGGQMDDVTAGGPGLVAVGLAALDPVFVAAVWTSPDGITWSRVPHDDAVFGPSGFKGMASVTAGGPGLVAVGGDYYGGDESKAAVWTSPDGITWSRVPHNESVFGGAGHQGMSDVTVGGPGLVAVGDDEYAAAVWVAAPGS